MEKYYTVKDVAKALSVSPNTIWRWIKENKIKSVKLPSGHTRISQNELDEFLKEKEVK